METKVQFKDVAVGICRLTSDEDKFVPEMSLPIKDILSQFAFIDNVRLADIAKQGYEFADDNEDDFDVENFDTLDPAEKEDLYNRAKDVIDKYNVFKEKQQEVLPPSEGDSVDETVIP